MGIYLGMASLYFAGCGWGAEMIDSYYRVRWIAVLNIIPVVLLMYLVYLLVNRMWLTIALSSAITMGLTWVNYYKLQFRGDPLLFEDLTLVFESKEMAGKYNIILLREMKIVILVVLVVTVLSAVLIKKRKSSGWFRIAGIIGLVLVFYGGITTVYSDSDVYNYKTENLGLINQWSATHQYLSRGFVYPFLNSIQYSRMTVPESYNKKEAMKALEQYKYADIPEDKKVNVIGIMLEAYNDFSKFPQIEYNVDIYEELHNIQAESYSGELTTNIFAGGTVNTERAFLTGFTTQPSFRKKTNTYVRYFAEQGYTVEGSHPCYDWFYNRKNINENLGFENYYFYENRYGEMAEGRIAEDAILMPDIIKCFEENKKTDKPYFNFSVTYQNHE